MGDIGKNRTLELLALVNLIKITPIFFLSEIAPQVEAIPASGAVKNADRWLHVPIT